MSNPNPPHRPDLLQELLEIREDPAVWRFALRRARDPELARDALQEAYKAVAQVADPSAIKDLRAYFSRVLIRKIHHLRGQLGALLLEDFTSAADAHEKRSTSLSTAARPAAEVVSFNLLAEAWFARFATPREELVASVPRRSTDSDRYRDTIVNAAKRVLYAIVVEDVSDADGNAALSVAYPEWFAEAGCPENTRHQRFSRARADVRKLLRTVVSRDELLPLAS